MEKPDKHDLSQVIKVNTNSKSDIKSMYPWYAVMKKIFYLCGLQPQNTYIQYNREKIIWQIPSEEQSTGIPLKTVKVMKIRKHDN